MLCFIGNDLHSHSLTLSLGYHREQHALQRLAKLKFRTEHEHRMSDMQGLKKLPHCTFRWIEQRIYKTHIVLHTFML